MQDGDAGWCPKPRVRMKWDEPCEPGEMSTGPSSIWGLCFSSGPCPCICPCPTFSHGHDLPDGPDDNSSSRAENLETVTECLQIGSEMLGKEAQQGKWEDKGWVLSDIVKSLGLSCHLCFSLKDSSKSSGEKNRHSRYIHPIQKETLKCNSDKWLICLWRQLEHGEMSRKLSKIETVQVVSMWVSTGTGPRKKPRAEN